MRQRETERELGREGEKELKTRWKKANGSTVDINKKINGSYKIGRQWAAITKQIGDKYGRI